MRQAENILDKVFWLTDAISRIMVCMIFVIMWIVVFGRYLFSYTPIWSEDLILFLMCWMVMLSGAEAFRRDAHLKITAFMSLLPDRVAKVLQIILDLATVVFFSWMVRYGMEQVLSNVTVMYTGLKISKMWVFASFPVSFVLCALAKIDKYIIAYNKSRGERRS